MVNADKYRLKLNGASCPSKPRGLFKCPGVPGKRAMTLNKLQRAKAKQTEAYRAGVEAARDAMAPILMRKYFVRGMVAGGVLGWVLITFGYVVIRVWL